MIVAELINELNKFPKDTEVFVWNTIKMKHSIINRCYQFSDKDIHHYLYMEDDEYSKDVNNILNKVILNIDE